MVLLHTDLPNNKYPLKVAFPLSVAIFPLVALEPLVGSRVNNGHGKPHTIRRERTRHISDTDVTVPVAKRSDLNIFKFMHKR